MKNIAILTLPFTWNYGGILQAFALAKFLEIDGHYPIVVSHRKRRTNIALNFLVQAKWKSISIFAFLGFDRFHRLFAVESFKRKWFRKIEDGPFSTKKLLEFLDSERVDIAVIGSDQVWRRNAIPDMSHYFLSFDRPEVSLKRVSYACSMGHSTWDYDHEETKFISKSLKGFSGISLRERQTQEVFEQRLGVSARTDIDPTLLLPASEYEQRMANPVEETPFLFSYILDTSSEKSLIESRISAKLGLNILNIFSQPARRQGVENWLGYIRHCSMVITDSYHGMLFAIIFRRPFIVFLNTDRGAERFTSILHDLGLQDRLVTFSEIVNTKSIEEISLAPIDWESVGESLERLRSHSASYLRRAINDD